MWPLTRTPSTYSALRVAYTSDLHIDNGHCRWQDVVGLADRISRARPDVLVIGGDIAGGTGPWTSEVFALLRPCAPTCLTVPGNHDIWVTKPNWRRQPDASWGAYHHYQHLARAADVTPLDTDGPVQVGSVGFAGCMGWYDYSLRDTRLDGEVSMDDYQAKWSNDYHVGWNDGSYCHWGMDDELVTGDQLARLERQLDELVADPAITQIVVALHHLPDDQLVVRKSVATPAGRQWNVANAWMGSALFGQLLDQYPKVRLVFCGHTHHVGQLQQNGRSTWMNGRRGGPEFILKEVMT